MPPIIDIICDFWRPITLPGRIINQPLSGPTNNLSQLNLLIEPDANEPASVSATKEAATFDLQAGSSRYGALDEVFAELGTRFDKLRL